MTGPDREHIEEANTEANEALQRAEQIRDRGARIAAGWVKSRQDNNFRMMLRGLGKAGHNA